MLTAVALAIATAVGCAGCSGSPQAPSMQAQPVLPAGADYFTVIGPAQRTYRPTTVGVVEYCPRDEFGRARCAYGELTSTGRRTAIARGKLLITVAPAGWGYNRKVTIAQLPSLVGSRPYSGWFWNRSHLVADSLGGNVSVSNLVTGTRPQNVGSTTIRGQYAGGMAHAEVIARDYLDTHDADACPLYYAATPTYSGSAPIPTSVVVDVQSCDHTIDQRVEVSNTAFGWRIDYASGAFSPAL